MAFNQLSYGRIEITIDGGSIKETSLHKDLGVRSHRLGSSG
jgi:hypothetical protein